MLESMTVADLLSRALWGDQPLQERQLQLSSEVQQVTLRLAAQIGLRPGSYAVGPVALPYLDLKPNPQSARTSIKLSSGQELTVDARRHRLKGRRRPRLYDRGPAGRADGRYQLTLLLGEQPLYETEALAGDDGHKVDLSSAGTVWMTDGRSLFAGDTDGRRQQAVADWLAQDAAQRPDGPADSPSLASLDEAPAQLGERSRLSLLADSPGPTAADGAGADLER
jgi:hypothetical protein